MTSPPDPQPAAKGETPALLPCPLCGGDGELKRYFPAGYVYCVVRCRECGAEGPGRETEEEAASGWNRRAASPAPPPDAEREQAIVATIAEAERLNTTAGLEHCGLCGTLADDARWALDRLATIRSDLERLTQMFNAQGSRLVAERAEKERLRAALQKVPHLRALAVRWGMEPVRLDKGDGYAHGNPECQRLAGAVFDLEQEIMDAAALAPERREGE